MTSRRRRLRCSVRVHFDRSRLTRRVWLNLNQDERLKNPGIAIAIKTVSECALVYACISPIHLSVIRFVLEVEIRSHPGA